MTNVPFRGWRLLSALFLASCGDSDSQTTPDLDGGGIIGASHDSSGGSSENEAGSGGQAPNTTAGGTTAENGSTGGGEGSTGGAGASLSGTGGSPVAVRDCAGLPTGDESPTPSDLQPLDYLEEVIDPVYGTSVKRITGEPGTPIPGHPGENWANNEWGNRTAYSTHQAWSADGSLLFLNFGELLLDGNTFEVIATSVPGFLQWSPVEPDIAFFAEGSRVVRFNARTGQSSVVFESNDYSNLDSDVRTSPSHDGRLLGVVAQRASDGQMVCFAVDLEDGKKKSVDILFETHGLIDSLRCGVTPSGRYLHLDGWTESENNNNNRFFDLSGMLISEVEHSGEECPGHGDLVLDESGKDLRVGVCKGGSSGLSGLVAFRVEDGALFSLNAPGASHTSGRATARPGWVYSSDIDGGEVRAIRLDGGRIEYFGSVHAWDGGNDSYWAQPQCVPSPDGLRLVCASNWGGAAGAVQSYVLDAREACSE